MNILKKQLIKCYQVLNPAIRIEKRLNQQLFFERRMQIDNNLLSLHEKGVTDEKYCDAQIIVSLTTYGRRIHSVYLTIESLMEQTMKANRIILWLDESFRDKKLPKSLEMLCDRGLEIAFCKDVRSYKKLVPALCKFPNDVIITADDDLLYDANMLENLILPYLENPHYIYTNRAHKILLDQDKGLKSYNDWEYESRCVEASKFVFPTGGGGVLYPPHSLDDEVLNEEVFMDICPFADDVWFKAMSLKKGTLVKRVETISPNGCEYLENPSVQDIGLFNTNAGNVNMNDVQLKKVFSKYNLYSLLEDVD